jgi:hypothetical protein
MSALQQPKHWLFLRMTELVEATTVNAISGESDFTKELQAQNPTQERMDNNTAYYQMGKPLCKIGRGFVGPHRRSQPPQPKQRQCLTCRSSGTTWLWHRAPISSAESAEGTLLQLGVICENCKSAADENTQSGLPCCNHAGVYSLVSTKSADQNLDNQPEDDLGWLLDEPTSTTADESRRQLRAPPLLSKSAGQYCHSCQTNKLAYDGMVPCNHCKSSGTTCIPAV